MGKIWVKTKYDAGMDMDVPHSHNIACAMYGFMSLGAELNTYHSLDDIYDKVMREDIVLDYISQCQAIFNKFGVEPYLPDYPEPMRGFLGRKIWHDTINSISADERKWSAGHFVKPVKNKAFTGKIISSIGDLVGCGNHSEDYEVIVSEPLDIMAEWRCFIRYDELIDVRPYGMIMDRDRSSYMYHYDVNVLRDMMETFRRWDRRPKVCSMDICYTKDGRTLLVEFNDAYALGNYGLHPIEYAKLISARWAELLGREDEYRLI